MDELTVSGKKYISAKRASELTGYAKDYIGQLARAGKVAATRFGRAWYVEEKSILTHANVAEPAPEGEKIVFKAPQATKITFHPLISSKPYSLPATWSSVRYMDDEHHLMPIITKPEDWKRSPESAEITNQTIGGSDEHAVVIERASPASVLSPESRAVVMPRVRTSEVPHFFDIPKPSLYAAPTPLPIKRRMKKASSNPIPALSLIALIVLAGISLSGIIFPSESLYSAALASDSVSKGIEFLAPVWDGFWAAGILQGGVAALTAFMNILIGSFSDFLKIGIDFLKNF